MVPLFVWALVASENLPPVFLNPKYATNFTNVKWKKHSTSFVENHWKSVNKKNMKYIRPLTLGLQPLIWMWSNLLVVLREALFDWLLINP